VLEDDGDLFDLNKKMKGTSRVPLSVGLEALVKMRGKDDESEDTQSLSEGMMNDILESTKLKKEEKKSIITQQRGRRFFVWYRTHDYGRDSKIKKKKII